MRCFRNAPDGGPPTANEIQSLIARMAEENRGYGEALRPELLEGGSRFWTDDHANRNLRYLCSQVDAHPAEVPGSQTCSSRDAALSVVISTSTAPKSAPSRGRVALNAKTP